MKMISSFKDSFVDSDNFCNVDERLSSEMIFLLSTQKNDPNFPPPNLNGPAYPKQKSMKDMIKEHFMGPALPSDGALSQSLLRRNILQTNSNNCSYRTSTCSIKSSFLVPRTQGATGNTTAIVRQSSNIRQSVQERLESCCFNEDESLGHQCEEIDQYQMMPRTIYNEIVKGADQKISQFVTSQAQTATNKQALYLNQALIKNSRKDEV